MKFNMGKKPGNHCGLSFSHSIPRWDEGIPLGSGQMGCLVWGEPKELHLSLDRCDLWDVTTPYGTDRPEFTYASLVRLAKEKDTKQIQEIFDAPYYYPVPTKLPAGRILLNIQSGTDICSRLYLDTAQADFDIVLGEKTAKMKGFIHAAKQIGVFSLGISLDQFGIELQNPPFGCFGEEYGYKYSPEERAISQGSLKQLKYEPARKGRVNGKNGTYILYFTQKVSEDFTYGILCGVCQKDKETLLCFKVAAGDKGETWLEDAFTEIGDALEQGYGRMLDSHVKWWSDYWDKSAVTLPDKMFEKQWYMTNYLLASCSRKGYYPMPLQGVWTADEDMLPPWKGDYHNDLNTQMSYYHYLKANHLPEGECFLDFLWDKKPQAEEFARRFYDTDGLCLPAVMTIDGQPLGGWPMYSLSPTNQIWLGWAFEQYYRYTGDEKFLRERAYPYLAGIARCMTGLLGEGQDGLYRLPISSSPEIHDDSAEAFVTPNSNYDLSLLQYLFQTLEELGGILKNGEEDIWRRTRNDLPGLAVNEKHVLMLSPEESLEESHRHLSTAMAIHPLRIIGYDTKVHQQIVDAVIADYERLGTKNWVGFSFCWMAELYAVQKNGDRAAEQLSIFWNNFCSPNGFHLNGDQKKEGYSHFTYRPFTLEANMCAADVLQEMLFSMRDGIIEFFPAIPKVWEQEEVSFSTLRGEAGLLVSARLNKGRIFHVRIISPRPMEVIFQGWTGRGERQRSCKSSVWLEEGENLFWME